MGILMSLIGIITLLFIAYLLSSNRRSINYRTVLFALMIQFLFGALVLYVPLGRTVLMHVSGGINSVIGYGNAGISFVFGGLVSPQMYELFGSGGMIFALTVLPLVVFFSSLISILYYLGIMTKVITFIGGGLQKLLKTSKAESMSAAANIFVGQTEAPLVIRPYIRDMTNSELFAVLCGGTASVAGSVMMGYAQMGVPIPYLVAAAFMAAPGGLLFAKILYPEVDVVNEHSDSATEVTSFSDDKPGNIFDAAAIGATSGMQLAMNIGAMLIAFISVVALVNGILGGFGGLFGFEGITLQYILGIIFQPVMFLLGVPWLDSNLAGSFLGQKIILNEFVAYSDFVKYLGENPPVVLADKSIAIVTFSLCGFASLGSIGVLIGGVGALAPTRRKDVARLGLKAIIGGTLSNLMSACIAGLFIELAGSIL
ncbi:NupC/NupG family nucleoside CNT transporter [Aeromonas veronii]|uniref:NupC/NupG family nucleoside CNT transporter n=1 Tax=Aeromonas veronii TaxID=654 RepID=UPI001116AB2C|nr:NupC/NupG family nucleoside CNT transporter [Aeromonas veronii]TNI01469.1 NupC/NupG family nucleoside CNT transporter [Aeromonas veronii]HDO1310168.1 NupC/NupG family nucleoside CNT transporter [Aeromonas veronii]HDO1317764.1 NupC/NupG family nucleoside CNT transporter [Aeromonas veronii]HDO1331663.1 NupC/NupG family nucleoside CNT transporter [Aeromonas veronii]HDO1336322.1 NupC/NupG family nucleoside CNT transporter [Aeromonas veronii]